LTGAALRLLLAACLGGFAATGLAGDAQPPSWRATLEQDLHGPAVTWTGIVIKAVRDGDYTCFVLQRVGSPAAQTFAACNPGAFSSALFGAGQALRVRGNLGEARERAYGPETFAGPLIAAATIERTALPRPPSPWWHDDFYYPYGYPHRWGIHYWP
jgi:hypothetical protein